MLVGGEPARACLSLTANCVDSAITTAEGLSTPLELSPLQASMVRSGAIQCGFCTPGMLVTLTAFLQRCPQPSRDEIRVAVSSNLCRCTGSSENRRCSRRHCRAKPRMSVIHTSVGHNVERLDAAEKVSGEAHYVDDLYRPGMLHGTVLGSIHAHAKIRGYKLNAARAIPGVVAILTGEDFSCARTGAFCKDEVPLARGKTIYMSEPVAAVAACDVETARRAANAIEIEYEPLPAVLTIDQALAADAPRVHDDLANYVKIAPSFSEGNVLWQCRLEEGKIDSAWAQCDVIVEDEFETAAQHHMYMEPCGALAEVDRGGRVTIWSSCQSVHLVQQRAAEWLSIPMTRIRALAPKIGGGFGGKGGLHVQHLAAALALKTGRPVKMVLSRAEDFEMVRSRHPARIFMKTGAKKNGTLLAREARILLDGGAYADESPTVLSFAVLMARGPYRIAHLRSRGLVVYTNKLKASAFRGFGNPQVTFAGENRDRSDRRRAEHSSGRVAAS